MGFFFPRSDISPGLDLLSSLPQLHSIHWFITSVT